MKYDNGSGCGQGAQAMRDVLAERYRQMNDEGWTREHDDLHEDGELAAAAAYYATPYPSKLDKLGALQSLGQDPLWPFKEPPKLHTRRRELVIAAALLLAEIERLDRIDAAIAEKKKEEEA